MRTSEAVQLAVEYQKAGNLQGAETIYRDVLKVQPDNFIIYNYLGNVLQAKGKLDDAILCYQKGLNLNPKDPGSYYNLGNASKEKGLLDDAVKYYQKAIELNPDYAGAYNNLANVLRQQNRIDESVAYYLRAIELSPNFDGAYYNLGQALQDKGQVDEAITFYQKALEINPNISGAYYNLGVAFKYLGRLNEAEACFRRVLLINPNCPSAYSSLLLLMVCNPGYDPQITFSEHLKFVERFEVPLRSVVLPHANEKNPARRLKVGYVSPDFRRHSVAYFIEPVIACHNKEQFEVYCYSDVLKPDAVTNRLGGYADKWRDITGISDEGAAELIRKDGIDILIDLAGHTSNNRLLLFARKPAPVQVSWIGYPATTGLSSIDYKIVDINTDPPGMTEQLYTEKLVRMPECFLCYQPDADSPGVGTLPASTSGHLTFGSFNHFAKETAYVLALWADILKVVPDSYLILKAKSFSDKSTRLHVLNMFAKRGITPERIELLPFELSTKDHLEIYNRVDIGLDTFPYNGTTTTCEAMWMGVPVITLAGNTHASRVGSSLLTTIGFPELAAKTSDEYISIAVGLAGDLKRLQFLRGRLRDTMRRSPLTDAKKFTNNLEMCYRNMWEKWCKGW